MRRKHNKKKAMVSSSSSPSSGFLMALMTTTTMIDRVPMVFSRRPTQGAASKKAVVAARHQVSPGVRKVPSEIRKNNNDHHPEWTSLRRSLMSRVHRGGGGYDADDDNDDDDFYDQVIDHCPLYSFHREEEEHSGGVLVFDADNDDDEEEVELVSDQFFYDELVADDSIISSGLDDLFVDDGGSSVVPPNIDINDMAMALRWTGELNRQLEVGSTTVSYKKEDPSLLDSLAMSSLPSVRLGWWSSASWTQRLRGGDGLSAWNPARGAPYRIPEPGADFVEKSGSSMSSQTISPSNALTVFHARKRRMTKANSNLIANGGATAWGPDLNKYLQYLVRLLELEDNGDEKTATTRSLVLTLAMMYLDRSCSVTADTLPARNDSKKKNADEGDEPRPKCPFVTPRTVHRLVLTSLLIACNVVRGDVIFDDDVDSDDNVVHVTVVGSGVKTLPPRRGQQHRKRIPIQRKIHRELGIKPEQLREMVRWMRISLGGGDDNDMLLSLSGTSSLEQLQEWKQSWESRFPPQ